MATSSRPAWCGETLSTAVRKTILRKRSQGCALREIASAVGFSHEAVRLVLKAHGNLPVRFPSHARPSSPCKVARCRRKRYCHGYCASHLGKLKRGTIDPTGKPIALCRTCRICGGSFFTSPRAAGRKMCDDCRPHPAKKRLPEDASALGDRVLRLSGRRLKPSAIAQGLSLPLSIVNSTIRKAQPTLNHGAIGKGLCARCDGKRNQFALHCDGCHEEIVIRQRDRLRRKYKRTPRCNKIGCRQSAVRDGFCLDCRAEWKNGKIKIDGRHVLVKCNHCPCRFVPGGDSQVCCVVCASPKMLK